ncbi:MAG: Gfo/Idh/MocA family oxidoreductase [Planctomycetota bacterium]
MAKAKRGGPIGVGVAGLGRAGWMGHCGELEPRGDRFAVVAASEPMLADRRAEFEARFAGTEARAYGSYEAMLADARVELVSIASRTADHEAQAAAALKAGKHVVLEKPMAGDLKAAKRIARVATKSAGQLLVRHNRRFETAMTAVRSLMKSKVLGKVHTIRLRRQSFQYRADWQALKASSGGQLLNWGPHVIDHGLVLMGSPVASVWSDLRRLTARGDAEDHVQLLLTAENGVVCDIEISGAVASGEPEWAVHGDRGSLNCTGRTIRLRHLDPGCKPKLGRATTGDPGGYGWSKGLEWVEREFEAEASEYGVESDIWDAVYGAVRGRKKYPITVEHALEVMRVIDVAKKGTPFA